MRLHWIKSLLCFGKFVYVDILLHYSYSLIHMYLFIPHITSGSVDSTECSK